MATFDTCDFDMRMQCVMHACGVGVNRYLSFVFFIVSFCFFLSVASTADDLIGSIVLCLQKLDEAQMVVANVRESIWSLSFE